MTRKLSVLTLLVLLVGLLVPASSAGAQDINTGAEGRSDLSYSHRLVVELESPPLVEYVASSDRAEAFSAAGKLDVASAAAQAYVQGLAAEQAAFVAQVAQVLPDARVATFVDEIGQSREATYQILVNAVALDAGRDVDLADAERRLMGMPGVRRVYRDYAHHPDLYASVPLINAGATWANPEIGGMANAGEGIKLASVDGGIHHDAPMFDNTGYSYPPGYPKGEISNTNGKIIVSRAYFREWDPPAPGDENPWPGVAGTPHGNHTASIAAGNEVQASYLGLTLTISGVAPKAYVMSYRVFYDSVTHDGSFYTIEGIAALEDAVADGADVINNSWGGGPASSGGALDPLDTALINATKAGVFVSMSTGNAGPGMATSDHPSADYISVAASTTDATLAAGRVEITAPAPVPAELQAMPMGLAAFGPPLPAVEVTGPFDFVPAQVISATNELGCLPFPAGSLTGQAVLISRGTCDFSSKVLNAQTGGAVLAVIYNSATGGDAIMDMGPGTDEELVTIPSVFIGRSDGLAAIDWYDANPTEAQLQVNTVAIQIEAEPDVVAFFSSRGPGVGNVLKPDITAPGVNILAQGFDPLATGEARHLGFGQASGTSMAAPHVAGAGILLKQIHPTWTPAMIKSALMSTSKYLDIFTDDGRPAQPLDMGAGRLDLTNAADPGVILDPPFLSIGEVVTGTVATFDLQVTSVATATETYTVSTLFTGDSFTNTTSLDGMIVSPASITLDPGESAEIKVNWDTTEAGGYGDRQGFLLLDGANHDAHLPAWMRVAYATQAADVLVIDNDGSSNPIPPMLGLPGFPPPDYTSYYTEALENLGWSYDVWDVDARAGSDPTFEEAVELDRYPVVIYQTGDNFLPSLSLGAPMAPTQMDLDLLVEYVNNGGRLLAFGQDLASATGSTSSSSAHFFYSWLLGAEWLQDSLNEEVFTEGSQLIQGLPESPYADMRFDISARGDGADNLAWVDEIRIDCIDPDYPQTCEPYSHLLQYTVGGNFVDNGYVAIGHRDFPTIARPGTTFAGSSIYFSFGLEGVNNDTDYNTREELLGGALRWTQAPQFLYLPLINVE